MLKQTVKKDAAGNGRNQEPRLMSTAARTSLERRLQLYQKDRSISFITRAPPGTLLPCMCMLDRYILFFYLSSLPFLLRVISPSHQRRDFSRYYVINISNLSSMGLRYVNIRSQGFLRRRNGKTGCRKMMALMWRGSGRGICNT